MIWDVAVAPDGRRLASASAEAPVYVWDLYGPAVKSSTSQLWVILQTDAHLGAMGKLLAAPDDAIGPLRDKIKPSAKIDEQQIKQFLSDLDNPKFPVREKAARELANLGDRIEEALRREVAANPSAEKTVQLKRLLERLTSPSPERLAASR